MSQAWYRWRSPAWTMVSLVALGCAAVQPRVITDTEARAVRDTVIALENATDAAVDHLDCAAAFERIGDQRPLFVSGGRVVRTREAFRDACAAIIAPRTGAVFVTDTVSAHVLSTDAAYVVREGVYTVNFKDGSSRRTYLVMTSIWTRQDGVWKMVHLHESSRPLTP
jgi:ketosteroid isomerase-like protein